MTTVTRFWWIRHAPVIDPEGRIYGASDIAADTSDTATFAGLAAFLPRDAVWVTSHLSRTRATAAAIRAQGLDLPEDPPADPDLAEQSFGDWQGMRRSEVYDRQAEWHRFWLAPATTRAPNGESFVDVMERVGGAIDRLLAAHAGRHVCVVAHGGVIRAAAARALGLSPQDALSLVVETCSVSRFDHIRSPDPAGEGMVEAWRTAFLNRIPGAGNRSSGGPVA